MMSARTSGRLSMALGCSLLIEPALRKSCGSLPNRTDRSRRSFCLKSIEHPTCVGTHRYVAPLLHGTSRILQEQPSVSFDNSDSPHVSLSCVITVHFSWLNSNKCSRSS